MFALITGQNRDSEDMENLDFCEMAVYNLLYKCSINVGVAKESDYMKKPINKLVRDNIPFICKENAQLPETMTLDDKAYATALHEKLKEEVSEYLTSNEIEELADIMEVIEALAENQGSSLEEVMKMKKAKQNKNGGFKNKVFLISVEEKI